MWPGKEVQEKCSNLRYFLGFQSNVLLLEGNNFLCESHRSSGIWLDIIRPIILEQPIVGQSEAPCLSLGKAIHVLEKGIMHNISPACFFPAFNSP